MQDKTYIALSVFQGVIDEVKAYRSQKSADKLLSSFEREQGIRDDQTRKYQREFNDTYATWYERALEE